MNVNYGLILILIFMRILLSIIPVLIVLLDFMEYKDYLKLQN